MWNWAPAIFNMMDIKILKYDDSIVKALNSTQLTNYVWDENNYSIIPFKPKQDPKDGWAVPYVTGHKYKIHFEYGLDFTTMQLDLSSKWQPDDLNLYLIFNFTDVRAQVDVITGNVTVPNATLLTIPESQWQTGDNVIYNDTATR